MAIDHAEHPGNNSLSADSSEDWRYNNTGKILFNFILLGIEHLLAFACSFLETLTMLVAACFFKA